MIKLWSYVKKVVVGIGLFIAGFFLIRRGIDASKASSVGREGKAKQGELEAKAELEKVRKADKINKSAEEKKKKSAEDLKKKSKISKTVPKKKKENLKSLPKKTQKHSQKSSRKGSR